MEKPDISEYTKNGAFKSTHHMKKYKTLLSKYRKEMRAIKKERLKNEVVAMIKSDICNYEDFAMSIVRIGLDSYTIKDLEQFLH